MDSCSRSDRILSRSTSIHDWRERCGGRAFLATPAEGGHRRSRLSGRGARRHVTGVRGTFRQCLATSADSVQQLVAHPDMLASASGKLELPTSVFDTKKTRIASASSYASTSGSSEQWADLEAQVLNKWDRKGKRPMRLLPDEKMLSAAVGGALFGQLTIAH